MSVAASTLYLETFLSFTLLQIRKAFLSFFDDWTLAKGEDYVRRKKVLDLKRVRPDEVDGKISGSNGAVYFTRLYLDRFGSSLQETECSCPVGVDCKHAAALYIEHLKQVSDEAVYAAFLENPKQIPSAQPKLSSFETPPAVSQATAPDPAMLPLPNEVRQSFTEFAQSIAPKPTPHAVDGAKSSPKSELVYLLGIDGDKDEPKIEIRSANVGKGGLYSKGTKISLDKLLANPPESAKDEDLEIVRFWFAISKSVAYWNASYSLSVADGELVRLLLTKILATNRCFFNSASSTPLKLGPELPAELVWEKLDSQQFRLSMVAKDGERTYKCLRTSVLPWYIDEDQSRCGPISIAFDTRKLKPLFTMRELTLDEAQRLPVLINDLDLSEFIPAPPVANKVVVKVMQTTPQLRIQTFKSWRPLILPNKQTIPLGEEIRTIVVSSEIPASSQKSYKDETGAVVVEKYEGVDTQLVRRLMGSMGFGEIPPMVLGQPPLNQQFFMAPDPEAWSNLDADKLEELRSAGWKISSEMDAASVPIELTDELFELEMTGEDNWWFNLALDIDVNGKKVSLLPVLVSAIRKLSNTESLSDSIDSLNRDGKFLGNLPDGTLISIPFERIRSILVSLKELIEKGLDPNGELPTVDAADLISDETLSRSRFIGAKKIIGLVQTLKSIEKIESVDEPRDFKTTLRPYQKDGLSWLQFLASHEFAGILADDMGLGKTIQLLAHICLEKENGRLTSPYLVLCPTSVLPNWLSEAEKFAPHLRVASFHGSSRHFNSERIKNADLVVTTYPLLSRDLTVFTDCTWHGVALDEAQAIKNHKTKMAQAARALKANHKFCLTGTPVENHLGELWSQFQFLLPGLLGDTQTFKNVFRDPIEKLGDVQQRKLLARRVKPFIMRRTKQEVAQELPDKTVIVQHIELEGEQRDLYETVRLASVKQVREEIAKKGFKSSQIMILDALLKMRQVCCDPRLVKLSAAAQVTETAKLDALIEMLEQQTEEGHKVLVFSQFTSMLELIEARLKESNLQYVKLTGDTKDRAKPVKEFQEGSTPIFLISLKAGGTGLNLTQADVVIHYDPWWNPAVEEQATDRAHRIGQTKKVFVYKLIAKGTIEQRMVEMQERKRAIASSVYDEEGNFNLKFSEQDLDALLQPIDNDDDSISEPIVESVIEQRNE